MYYEEVATVSFSKVHLLDCFWIEWPAIEKLFVQQKHDIAGQSKIFF